MNAATLPIIALAYSWAYAKMALCEYQENLLTLAIVGTSIAVFTFVVHLSIRKLRATAKPIDLILLTNFFVLRIGAVSALIFATGYLQIATVAAEEYKAFGIQLKIELGSRLIAPPEIIKLQSAQPLTVVGSVRECKNSSVKWAHEPPVGVLEDHGQGLALYRAPELVVAPSVLSLLARSPQHNDVAKIHIQLVPSQPGVTRYPVKDPRHADTLYDFIVLSNTETWMYKRIGEVSGPNDENAVDACAVVARLQNERLLENYQAVVAIGTASREGSDSDERVRAGERATKLAACTDRVLRSSAPVSDHRQIYTLNLGRFQAGSTGNPSATAGERRAILIGLITGKRTEAEVLRNFNLGALRAANQDPFVRFLSDNYSPGVLEPWPKSRQ